MKKHVGNLQKKSVVSMAALIFCAVSIQAMDENLVQEDNDTSYNYSSFTSKVNNFAQGMGDYFTNFFAKEPLVNVAQESNTATATEIEVAKVADISEQTKTTTTSTSWMPKFTYETLVQNQKILAGFVVVGVVVIGGSVYVLYKKGVFDKAITFVKNNKLATGLATSFVAGAIALAIKIATTPATVEKTESVALPAAIAAEIPAVVAQ